jgi:hypothetical protein
MRGRFRIFNNKGNYVRNILSSVKPARGRAAWRAFRERPVAKADFRAAWSSSG